MLKKIKLLTLRDILFIIGCLIFTYMSIFIGGNNTDGWDNFNKPFKQPEKEKVRQYGREWWHYQNK